MIPFSAALASLREVDGEFEFVPSDDWGQGRTLFGGLSAALAVESAQRKFAGLPPLRSAQIAFTGPATGTLHFAVELISSGKSATFVIVKATTDSGTAMHSTLCFGATRMSTIDFKELPTPAMCPPDECENFFVENFAPRSTAHFDGRLAGGARAVSGADRPELLLWLRHRDPQARNDVTSVIALADGPPPGAMLMFSKPAPISTMTWSIDLLTDRFVGAGWHVARTSGDVIKDGYCSQSMTLWDAEGRPIAASRQQVAIYT